MGEIQLKKWTVRLSAGGICVDGLRVDDASGIYWHSSSIVKRINGRLLETNSGSRYRLLGDLDEIYAKQVSDNLYSLIGRFKRGFPKKWKSLFEATERATAAKIDGDKKRTIAKTLQAPDNKTQSRQNMTGKQSNETLSSVCPVSCQTHKRRAVPSNKGIGKETPKFGLHSVTRSITKKLQEAKTRIMPDSDGNSSDDTLSGTILALRKRSSPLGRNLRKRKQSSDIGTASKKRRVNGHSVGKSLNPEFFPTPESQTDDVGFGSFSSQGTSLKKRMQMISTTIEPDILTVEGLLSPPENAREIPRKMVSGQRITINPVIVPFDLGEEFEEDILQRSFLDIPQSDFVRRQRQPRSRTVQPKQYKASTKQRKSQATSKSQNLQSGGNSPEILNLKMLYGGHNLRSRTAKKDVIPGTTAELQGKSQKVESKSRCNQRKHQPIASKVNGKSNQQMTAKTTESKAVSESKVGRKVVTVKSSLVKGPAKQRSENCERKQTRGSSVDDIRSISKKDSRNHVLLASPSTAESLRKLDRLRSKSSSSKKKQQSSESIITCDNIQQMTVKTSESNAISGSTVEPIALELHTLRSEEIVSFRNDKMIESVTQGKNLVSGDDEPDIAERFVVTESTSTINVDRAIAESDGLERIGDLFKNLKPTAKKAVTNKKKNAKRKENDGVEVTETVDIENGQSSIPMQRLHDQVEENMSSTAKVIPSLPGNSVQVEAVEECCLAKCSEENVAVDVARPNLTKKSRKVAEVPDGVVSMKNQSQKSHPKSNIEQTKKVPEMNNSLLAKKNNQITNVKLLGGRGTLKRQKELRKLVEKNMHCEDNNDFFSSTPFQGSRVRHFVFEDDDDIFAEGDLSKALNCDMADVTPHGLFRVMDYTANKTPAATPSTSTTPAGIKRRRSEQEAYVHRVKKMLHLGQRKGHKSRRNIPKKPRLTYVPVAGASRMTALSVDKDLFEAKEVREQDSEGEEDCYFADD